MNGNTLNQLLQALKFLKENDLYYSGPGELTKRAEYVEKAILKTIDRLVDVVQEQ